jgi:hypothetical protein
MGLDRVEGQDEILGDLLGAELNAVCYEQGRRLLQVKGKVFGANF